MMAKRGPSALGRVKIPDMKLTSVLLSAVLLAVLVSGCGGKAASHPVVVKTVTVTVTAAPKLPSRQAPAKLGQRVFGEQVTARVIRVDQSIPVDTEVADGQKRWASALVQVCATASTDSDGKPLEVSWAAWQIADASGGTYNITDITGGVNYQLPTYPQDDQRLTKGQCVKGWIPFNVAPGVKLTTIIYSNGDGKPIYWSTS